MIDFAIYKFIICIIKYGGGEIRRLLFTYHISNIGPGIHKMSSFFEIYLTFWLFRICYQSLPSNKNAVSGKNIRWN